MGKQVRDYKKKEDRLNNRVNSLHSELRHVEKEENELKKKERSLEAREDRLEKRHGDNWGEGRSNNDKLEVHMNPLTPHGKKDKEFG